MYCSEESISNDKKITWKFNSVQLYNYNTLYKKSGDVDRWIPHYGDNPASHLEKRIVTDSGTDFLLGRCLRERHRSISASVHSTRGHLIYAYFASTQVSFEHEDYAKYYFAGGSRARANGSISEGIAGSP